MFKFAFENKAVFEIKQNTYFNPVTFTEPVLSF